MPHQLPLDPRKPGQLGPTATQALAQAQQNPQATGGILPLSPVSPPTARQAPAAAPPTPAATVQPSTGQQQAAAQQPQTRADMIRQFIPQFKDNPIAAIGFVSLVLGPATTIAHHSAAPFDFTRRVVFEGLVKEIKVVNPHASFVLEVTDEERGTRDIEFEGMSASIFYRSGYFNGSVELGDVITVTIAPRHTGEDGGFISSFVTAGGDEFGFGVP